MTNRYDLGRAPSLDFAKALLDLNLVKIKVITVKFNFLYTNDILKILK